MPEPGQATSTPPSRAPRRPRASRAPGTVSAPPAHALPEGAKAWRGRANWPAPGRSPLRTAFCVRRQPWPTSSGGPGEWRRSTRRPCGLASESLNGRQGTRLRSRGGGGAGGASGRTAAARVLAESRPGAARSHAAGRARGWPVLAVGTERSRSRLTRRPAACSCGECSQSARGWSARARGSSPGRRASRSPVG